MLDLPASRPLADGSDWDVVVAGAGPAGSVAAAHAARAGLRVLLVDRDTFPRDKVCGDGLIADALGALDRVGARALVEARARALDRTAIYSASRHRIDLTGRFLTLKRLELDTLLAACAVDQGVTLATATVEDIRPDASGVTVSLAAPERRVRAQYAILATGADRVLGRRAGLPLPPTPSAIAVRCYVRSTARLDRLLISYDRDIVPGYGWIFPLRRDEYNIGCGVFYRDGVRGRVNLRRMFDRFVETFPDARDLMRGALSATPLKGAPLQCGLAAVEPVVPRVLPVGETISTTFPFTGEGIGKAMESGELAAGVVIEAVESRQPVRIEAFSAMVRRRMEPKYLGYRAAERWLSRPWLTDLLARRARRSSFVRQALGGVLNETIDPRTVFSLRGLARSLYR